MRGSGAGPVESGDGRQGSVPRLHRLATAYWVSKAVSVAASLRLADHLTNGQRTAEDLAQEVGADPDRLGRLMRALADEDVFECGPDGAFGLGPLGELLRSDHPESLRDFVAMLGDESYRAFDGLLETVRGGPPAFEIEFGRRFYDHLSGHYDAAARFDGAMAERHSAVQAELPAGIPARSVRSLVDVGGGEGRLAIELLAIHPELRVTILERSQVAPRARAALKRAGLAHRGEVVCGDFFSEVPSGADGYLLASVLHNWDDPEATLLLERVGEAMRTDSRLWIVELLVPEDGSPSFATLLDLEIMVLTGGRERTQVEHRRLLERAGLRAARIVPSGGRMTIIEAERNG